MTIALSSFHVPNPPPGEDELPCDDGEPMETERHLKQMNILISTLEIAWDDRSDFYVGGNMAIYFSELQVKKNDFRGPDVFVVMDTIRREHKSWVVWQEEGKTPDVVIELISPTTEHVDRGEKMDIYARLLHVGHYYLFDPETALLEGYHLDSNKGEYIRMEPLPNGDLPCPRLGLHLGLRHGVFQKVEADWLRWIDESGRVFPTGEENALAAQKDARAAQENARAAQENARAAQENARAAEAQAFAAQEQARTAQEQAQEEARLRTDAERRLAEALAELERLKGSDA